MQDWTNTSPSMAFAWSNGQIGLRRICLRLICASSFPWTVLDAGQCWFPAANGDAHG